MKHGKEQINQERRGQITGRARSPHDNAEDDRDSQTGDAEGPEVNGHKQGPHGPDPDRHYTPHCKAGGGGAIGLGADQLGMRHSSRYLWTHTRMSNGVPSRAEVTRPEDAVVAIASHQEVTGLDRGTTATPARAFAI